MSDEPRSVELPSKLMLDLKRAALAVRKAVKVTVITHIDADGIAAGAIASETLKRLGKEFTMVFEKKVTPEVVDMVNACASDLVWICDLGSSQMSQFVRNGLIVTDHHAPDSKWRSGQSLIDAFGSAYQLNPHVYGVSGSYEVCGAGMTYLLSKTVDPANIDLAYLAVVGAIGDFQDSHDSRLTGWNRMILQDAVDAGDVEISQDIRYFGRCTRPLAQFVQYGEPALDGLTGDAVACNALFSDNGIPLSDEDGTKRTWCDLSDGERETMTRILMSRAGSDEVRSELFGEVYLVKRYPRHAGVGDAKEFSTILNSCGRYDDAETGIRICQGDMEALIEADVNRKDHRKNISVALAHVRENHLLLRRKYVQFFNAGSAIRDTIIGIVAGMVLESEEASPDMPIIAFAETDDGIKVSARAPKKLVDDGLDLSKILSEAAAAVGGLGGGHSVAAGATIPAGKEEVFLDKVEALISSELSS